MTTPFDRMIEDVRQVQSTSDQIVIDQVQREESFVVRLQADQMYEGQRGDGQEILPPYRPATILIKRSKGQPTDRVTLRDTGDFHDSIVIEYGPDSFRLDATDNKRARLVRKYGEQIFGFNPNSLQELIDQLRDGIVDRMQKTILSNG